MRTATRPLAAKGGKLGAEVKAAAKQTKAEAKSTKLQVKFSFFRPVTLPLLVMERVAIAIENFTLQQSPLPIFDRSRRVTTDNTSARLGPVRQLHDACVFER